MTVSVIRQHDLLTAQIQDCMHMQGVPAMEITVMTGPYVEKPIVKVRYYPMLDVGHAEFAYELPEDLYLEDMLDTIPEICKAAKEAYINKMREVLEKYENI